MLCGVGVVVLMMGEVKGAGGVVDGWGRVLERGLLMAEEGFWGGGEDGMFLFFLFFWGESCSDSCSCQVFGGELLVVVLWLGVQRLMCGPG